MKELAQVYVTVYEDNKMSMEVEPPDAEITEVSVDIIRDYIEVCNAVVDVVNLCAKSQCVSSLDVLKLLGELSGAGGYHTDEQLNKVIQELSDRIDLMNKRIDWLVDINTLSPSQMISKRQREERQRRKAGE